MDIKVLKELNSEASIVWTTHCLRRMGERDINRDDVRNGIETGRIIEEYPNDLPHPSCLVFGYTVHNRVLHIVVGCDNIKMYMITVYYPNTEKFEDGFKVRRKDG